ncbi:restriction endonuclease subunit S [Methylobacterium indicum]|uniref:restriction endonuclease subunit S n=1 Tax=Methylobacterium indicum TaxID=1775910 RepID=UPI0009E8A459|nr:restriction endonuclease subunit S [Methylobacterium indicum]
MSFPAYLSYKESGVEWLGKVPSHWTLQRLGGSFVERREKVNDTDFPPLSVTKNGIVPQLDTAAKTDDNDNRKCVRAGDFVINSRSDRKGSSGLSSLEGSVSLINTVITPDECFYHKYVHYLLRSSPFQEEFYRYGKGIVADLWSTNYSEMKNINLAYPDKSEQIKIAGFLDREIIKIDDLVDEQRRLIALLKEKRQAVISHAVTKGLNTDVPMKDSSIDWIGEVPSHWDVNALKRHWSVIDCKHITAEFVEEGIPLASIREVQSRYVDLSSAKKTTYEYYNQMIEGGRKPEFGDLIFSRNATVGEVAQVADWHPPFAMGQDVCLLRNCDGLLLVDFLQYYCKSLAFIQQVNQLMIGSTFKRINIEEIRNIIITIPPVREQIIICNYISNFVNKADDLIKEAEKGVALLHERRDALISAAVTGKINVLSVSNLALASNDRVRSRGLIAVEIIERSAHQSTFGRVKLQKIAYLAEAHAGVIELEGDYLREAAGPLDREMIREMEREAGALADIRVNQPAGAGSAVVYQLGDQRGAHRKELTALLGERTAKLDRLIKDISTINTKGAEAVATLYAVWNDALINRETPSDMEIALAVLSEWHPEKAKKFGIDDLHAWLNWMRRHGLTPTGTGPKTSIGRLFA